MANSELPGLAAITTLAATDLLYVVVDPGGAGEADKKIEAEDAGTALIGLGVRPTCRVYRNAALTLVNNGQVPIAWDATSFDPSGLHDPGSNPSRVLLAKVGYWQCSWQIVYEANATGVRDASLAKNGAIVSTREVNNSGAAVQVFIAGSDFVQATAITDYVEVWPFQNSGNTRNFVVGATNMFLSVAYIGP